MSSKLIPAQEQALSTIRVRGNLCNGGAAAEAASSLADGHCPTVSLVVEVY